MQFFRRHPSFFFWGVPYSGSGDSIVSYFVPLLSLLPPALSFPMPFPSPLDQYLHPILCTSTFSRVQQNLRIQVYCALTALLVVIARLLWLLSFQGEDREIRASGWWRVWSCEWPNKWTAHWSNAQIAIFAERTWCREKCAGIQVSYLLFYLDFLISLYCQSE